MPPAARPRRDRSDRPANVGVIGAAVFREKAREVLRPPAEPVLHSDADHEARPGRLRESESSMRAAPPAPESTNCTVATFS